MRSGECVRESAGVEVRLELRRPRRKGLHKFVLGGTESFLSDTNDVDVDWVKSLRESRTEMCCGRNEPMDS
jgi:hypothetical protein